MKFLVCIPCLYNAEATQQAIESVVNHDVKVVLMDNGAEESVKRVINQYTDRHNVWIERSPDNIYVNPAWNLFVQMFFQSSNVDYLIILNSDLVLQKDWLQVLKTRLRKEPNEITLPVITGDAIGFVDAAYMEGQTVYVGTPGVFICLSKECAQLIHPIPSEIKIWFGDNWIYDQLRGMGYKTTIAPNLYANHYHGGSRSVSRLQGISEIIEQDKVQWATVVEKMMLERIEEYKAKAPSK